jgi:hypothetical protein
MLSVDIIESKKKKKKNFLNEFTTNLYTKHHALYQIKKTTNNNTESKSTPKWQ